MFLLNKGRNIVFRGKNQILRKIGEVQEITKSFFFPFDICAVRLSTSGVAGFAIYRLIFNVNLWERVVKQVQGSGLILVT